MNINFLLILLNIGICYSTITIFDENNSTITNFDSLTSGFGPRITEDGFQGYIVVAKPISGCSKIEPPPNISYIDPKSWIALIQRTPSIFGNCSFDVKVHNAQIAGYSAVIIFNSESDSLIKMSSSGYFNIKIPSVFIGHSSGLEIISSYTYENKTYALISNDDSDLNYLLIPFVSVVSVCFLIAMCIFVIKLGLHCKKMRKNRFPKSALKKIPTKKYQKTDKYDTCPICLNEYEEGVKIRILPCEHVYHIECIDKWLLRNNRLCPVCKRRVIPGDSDSENEDSTNSSNSNQRRMENEANEDDDTNESSRLLINNNQNNRNEDNSSLLTTSTNLHNFTSGSNLTNLNNDLSSLNNHMTTSISSNQMINAVPSINNNNNNNNNLLTACSSSKYGSISSINLIENNNLNNATNENINIIDNKEIDSKHTPEYFSITSDHFYNEEASSSTSPLLLSNTNLDKQLQLKTLNKSNSKKNKKSTNTKPITNVTLSKIAADLEENRIKKEEAEGEEDVDEIETKNTDVFQSVVESDDLNSRINKDQ